MSTEDGLERLLDFLNTTRRQAELSIATLSSEVDAKERSLQEALSERDYYKNYAEQLKLENSKKWRLQERDDWKSLVESVQSDRARLQDQCFQLETSLEAANDAIRTLEDELAQSRSLNLASASLPTSPQQSPKSRDRTPSNAFESFVSDSSGIAADFFSNNHNSNNNSVFDSPMANRHGLRINTSTLASSGSDDGTVSTTATATANSPRGGLSNRQMKLELDKALAQMEVERRAAAAERLSHEAEIERLRSELQRFRSFNSLVSNNKNNLVSLSRSPSNTALSTAGMVPGLSTDGVPGFHRRGSEYHTSSSGDMSDAGSWLDPVDLFFRFLFSTNDSSNNSHSNRIDRQRWTNGGGGKGHVLYV